jgi:hypothetical protein
LITYLLQLFVLTFQCSFIRAIVNKILKRSLESTFIGIHLRAEQDVYENDASFDEALPRIIKSIKNDQCFFAYFDKGSIPKQILPQIYVASGLFTTDQTYGAKDTNSSTYRQNAVMKALKEAGLTNVVTRSNLDELSRQRLGSVSKKYLEKTSLYAEQHAYIDLLILQKASCFIPAAPKGSSLSYVVQRFRSFEIGDFGGDLLVKRSPKHMDFQSWGF